MKSKSAPSSSDQLRPVFGIERFQQRRDIDFVQVGDECAQQLDIAGLDGGADAGDEVRIRTFGLRPGSDGEFVLFAHGALRSGSEMGIFDASS